MPILNQVEDSLKSFRPKTHRQFVAFNIASRFEDVPNLARYVNIAGEHSKKVLLEAARLAEQRCAAEGTDRIETFFELLEAWRRREAA